MIIRTASALDDFRDARNGTVERRGNRLAEVRAAQRLGQTHAWSPGGQFGPTPGR